MKKLLVLALVAVTALLAGTVRAQQSYPLGYGNFAVKVDYLRFTDGEMDDLGVADAPYIGAEFYFPVMLPNLYLGIESGYAWSSGDQTFTFIDDIGRRINFKIDLDVDYVPIEFNAKYVFELAPSWTFDVGGGISYSYFNIDASADVYGGDVYFGGDSDWLLGGQFFADMNYKMGQWFLGGNVKYQLTEDLSFDNYDSDVSAGNFRVGGQFGLLF